MKEPITLKEALNIYGVKMATIERLAGIPKGLLSQYVNGTKKCSPERLFLIEDAFKQLGKDMEHTKLVAE